MDRADAAGARAHRRVHGRQRGVHEGKHRHDHRGVARRVPAGPGTRQRSRAGGSGPTSRPRSAARSTARVEPAAVVDVSLRLVDLGADEICLGDTIGVGVPSQVHELTGAPARRGHPARPARLPLPRHARHGAGQCRRRARRLASPASTRRRGGTGGCPYAPGAAGNLATEDLVYLLDGMGIETRRLPDGVLGAARFIAGALGRPLAARSARPAAGTPRRASHCSECRVSASAV